MKYSPSYKFWKMAVSIFCRRNSWWLLQQVLAYTFFTFIPTKNIFKNFSNICDEVFLWKHLTVSSWMFGTDLNAPLTFCLKLVASAWFEFVLIWPKIILLFPLSFKFYQIFQKCLKNYQKCFLFLLKNSFRSRDSQCFVIFSLPFHCFQVQRIRWNWNNYDCNGTWTRSLVSFSRWVFIYELSGCGFESHCCHLNFRYHACFEEGFRWH